MQDEIRLDAITLGSDATRVDWVVDSRLVSGLHARIVSRGSRLLLEDLGSTNGTFLRGERLRPGTPVEVSVGDLFTLGRQTAVLVDRALLAKFEPGSSWRGPQTLQTRIVSEPPVAPRTAPAPSHPPVELEVTHESGLDDTHQGLPDEGPVPVRRPTPADFAVEVDPPAASASSLSIGYAEGNDIVVTNPVVSGRHARLYLDRGRLVLEDQTSTNGTWLGGQRVHRVIVRVGDAVMLGSHRLEIDEAMVDRLRDRDAARAVRTGVVEASGAAPGADLQAFKSIRVGRDPLNELVIDAPMVSSFHCVIAVLPGGGLQVRDEGSTNGTWLNSRENRITTATIRLDDVLYLGSYRLPISRLASLLGDAERKGNEIALPPKQVVVIGRDASAVDVVIDRPQVSRRHVELRLLGGDQVEVRDLGSSNGTFVNGQRLRGVARVGFKDRVSLGSVQLRIDVAAGLIRKEYHGDIMLQAEGICVDVPDGRRGTRRIVDDVSFTVYPTEFVGLMGPSGAGKTTLMMALNGYTPPSAGRSVVNGIDLYDNYDSFRGNIGYVPQDDIIFPQLTVYESLYYTARLRLPADTTRDEIDRKIEQVLQKLEIQQTRDVLIGDATRKGISGGQRKRVNLAQELITEPSLLFLDEPTSGLASEDTINVMRLLRTLSDDGKTILLTIHQPSLEAYRLMDNVIYLVQGAMAYYGPSHPDSILYFHPDVAPGPERDRLLADPASAMRPLAVDQRAALSEPTPQARQERIRELTARRRAEYTASRYHKELVSDRLVSARDVDIHQGSKQKTTRHGMWRQWAVLSARAARIRWKDRANTAILTVQAPIIAAVLALVFSKGLGGYFGELSRGPAALFLLVASAVWFGCSNSAREIVGEQAIYRRERMVNLMIPSYVLSKFAVLGVVCAVQCALLLGITYLPLGLDGSPALMYLVLLLTSLAGLGMGLTLSAVAASTEAAIALVPLLLIPQIILGGVIMPVHQLSEPMRALSSVMAARWGFEALLHAEYGDDDLARVQSECGIPDCVWGVNPATSRFVYYPGDPARTQSAEQMAGIAAMAEGLVPHVEPAVDDDLCQAFCVAVQNGQDLTPLDRGFGADAVDPVRAEAVDEIARVGTAPSQVTLPPPTVRTSLPTTLAALCGGNLFLLLLVIAVLRARDVEVE
jgi:ABC-type multidrug transport system ATPase subunit/pSer/pThr/pTyr-binding forkhead associated (FHA) protein/ABC-type polysaccharide/polyol phosphate export permease